jgi:ribosomal protein RSM22 (predicted rRNA methylase)
MTSHHGSISTVVGMARELQPTSVLDVGAGFGKYGVLMREYFPNAIIEAVEPNAHQMVEVYDTIHRITIEEYLDRFTREFDLGLLIAVMYRFNHEEGQRLLGELRKRCRHLILTLEKKQHGDYTQWVPENIDPLRLVELEYEWVVLL